MKKALPVIIIVAILVVAGVGYFATKHTTKSTNSSTTSSTGTKSKPMEMPSSGSATSTKSGSSTTTAPASTSSVTIKNFAFAPSSITVKKGTTVTWTNEDSIAHTVTETDGKTGPSSGDLAKGQTYSFTYNETGTFAYNCKIHPYMTGSVIVTD